MTIERKQSDVIVEQLDDVIRVLASHRALDESQTNEVYHRLQSLRATSTQGRPGQDLTFFGLPQTDAGAAKLLQPRAVILLCDAAQCVSGKLNILGGGWSVTHVPMVSQTAIAVLLYIPWDWANTPRKWTLGLYDADGQPFMGTTPHGPQHLAMEGDLEVGRPAGLSQGSEIEVPMALTIPPLIELQPNARYIWRFNVTGMDEPWTVAFKTFPGGPLPPGATI